MASFNHFGIVPIPPLNFTSGAAGTSRSNMMLLANDTCHRLLVVRAVEEGTAPPHNAAASKPKQPPVGPKRGTKVKILRKESYWSNGIGSVVAVDPDPKTHYRVVVRFDNFHHAFVSTDNYALDEIEEINKQ